MSTDRAQFDSWWNADKDMVHERVIRQVQTIEQRQFDLFNSFVRLEALYDPVLGRNRDQMQGPMDRFAAMATENVVASNIDTVTAIISATEVRARFMTDDADWSEQRRARHLEWYAEGLSTLLDVDEKCRQAFRDSALKGTGLLKVYVDDDDQICVDRVQVDDIVVDEAESRFGSPRQMHQRAIVDRENLIAQFPDYEREILAAHSANTSRVLWADYRPIQRNEVVVVESWHLPRGVKPTGEVKDDDGNVIPSRYRPGRHTICVSGATLLDEEWDSPTFPFVRIVWTPRPNGWYGISLAERIAGIQRALNRRNWHITSALDKAAAPITYINIADAKLAAATVNRVGTMQVIRGAPPTTVNPPQVSGEIYQSRIDLKNAAFEESGVSRMTAQAAKPAGIDSGVAMREYRDQTTQRFSLQEKAFERLKLDTVLAMIACAKQLGSKAPKVQRRTKFGSRRMEWSKVDMGDARISIQAASTIARTPAGRMQTVLEWAQAGVVSLDEARRLMQHPDLERSMSIYTEALDNIEEMLERIEDGEVCMPEPYQNLKMLVWRGQMEYMKIQGDGAPEEILENLRQCIVQAAYILSPPPANTNGLAMPGAGSMPGQALPSAAPPMPGPPGPGDMQAAQMPAATPGVAAFSPQAMQLVAG